MSSLDTCLSSSTSRSNRIRKNEMEESSTLKLVRRARIPLEHIDEVVNINSSVKHYANKKRVCLQSEQCKAFEMGGGFPSQIVSINQPDRLSGIDIQIGDYIVEINGQNVSRAVSKTIQKMLRTKTSMGKSVIVTIYRKPNHQTPRRAPLTKPSSSSSTISKSIKSLLSLFSMPKSCVSSRTPPITTSNRPVKPTDEETMTIDYGYYSIPSSSRSSASVSTSASNSSSSQASATIGSEQTQPQLVGELEYECGVFRDKALEMIETYVRPSRAVLASGKFEELFSNFEKFEPISRHLLALIRSGDVCNYPEKLIIVLDTFKTYLQGLPRAILLLDALTGNDASFNKFVEDLNETYSYQLMDCLFMPLKFVQIMLHHLYELCRCRRFANEFSSSCEKLGVSLDELYELTTRVFAEIEAQFCSLATPCLEDDDEFMLSGNEDDDNDDLTNVSVARASQLSFEDTTQIVAESRQTSSSSSMADKSIELIPIRIRSAHFHQWTDANLTMRPNGDNQIKCNSQCLDVDLSGLSSMRPSKNETCLHVEVASNGQRSRQWLTIKFGDEKMRNYVFKRLVQYIDI